MKENTTMNTNNKTKTIIIYISAFIVPIMLLVFVYAAVKIYPFGGKSLLIKDLQGQYVSFFANYRDILMGHGSIFYSFSKNLGGNMLDLFAYYLSSPLNIIFLFFPKTSITEAILVLTLLKTGLCGLTFCIYLRGNYKRNDFSLLIFSACYALMAYNIAYQQNIMWLDVIIWFPLVMLGIDRIIDHNSFVLYIVSLTISILTNFYIAYMVCIFSLFYFLYKLFISLYFNNASERIKKVVKKLSLWGISSLISGGLSAFLLLPAVEGLKDGKATFEMSKLTLRENFRLFDIISKMYIGAFNWDQIINGLPNIFCGILIIVLVALYFLNRSIRTVEKLCTAVLLAVILVSFQINALNLVWHLFNYPFCFFYRYAFIFSFIMIITAYRSFVCLERMDNRKLLWTGAGFTVVSIFLDKFGYAYLSAYKIYITTFMALLYCGILYYLKRNGESRVKAIFRAICIMLVFFELGLNSLLTLRQFDYADRRFIVSYLNTLNPEINKIAEKDRSFYRVEKTFQFSTNDSMLLNYNGLSHFSSTSDINILRFIAGMGYRSNKIWSFFNKGSTIAADSILDIKYVISKYNYSSYYNRIDDFDNNKAVYENPYVLPVGFMVNSSIQKVSIKNNDPFDLQNRIINSMVPGQKTDYFCRMPVKAVSLQNITVKKAKGTTQYLKDNLKQDGYIEFLLKCQNDYPVYAFFPANKLDNVSIYINDKPFGTYFNVYNYGVLSLGSFKKGSTISLRMRLLTDKVSMNGDLFYYLDMDRFKNVFHELSKNVFRVGDFGSTHFTGTVEAAVDKTVLFTSIPFDSGWSIKVDGREADKIELLNSLLGVRLPAGKSSIQMTYIPPGFTEGIIISVVSLLLLSLLIIAGHLLKITHLR